MVLLSTFNYIYACVGMMLFMKNDPFHFGSLFSAFLTMQVRTRLVGRYAGGRRWVVMGGDGW